MEFDFPDDSKSLEIRHVVDLPADDTTYWCSVHKLPDDFNVKHHAIQYEPIMTPGSEHLLHHMEVFLCVPDDEDVTFPIWSGKKFDSLEANHSWNRGVPLFFPTDSHP